ncbi:MAG: TonB-dependent receptor [Acidobacteria bacterium]|nr:TonB-dependent receptor [Acidobacteriota bacterium]
MTSKSLRAGARTATVLLALLLDFVAVGLAFAQANTGTIVGTVHDGSGGVLPAVTITIRNEGTNASRTVVTTLSGDYSAPLLPPGSYEVVAELDGFEKAVFSRVQLQVNQTVRINVALGVAALAETVNVVAEAPLIQTDTSSLGQVVGEVQIQNLPLNERNFVNFAYLAPGVQIDAENSLVSSQGLALSANGARQISNNFLLNGIDNNDLVINQYSAVPSVEAIQEFKVQTGTYSAEYGRSSGAQINVVLKSGMNAFHGSVFEYMRSKHLDSKNAFDLPDCGPTVTGACGDIPELNRHQFGFSLGGPIKTNKTFFFTAFEYLRLRQADTRFATVPSRVQKAEALAAVPAEQRSVPGFNIFNLYPDANVGDPQTSNRYLSAPVIRQRVPAFVGKIDQILGDNDNISLHYVMSRGHKENPFDPLSPYTQLPGYGTTVITNGQNGGASWNHVFNTRILNEFRAGFNGEEGVFTQSDKTDHNTRLGFPTVLTDPIDLGFPNVAVAGFDGIGQPTNTPQDHPTYTLHLMNNFAWNPAFNSGRHQLRMGGEFRRYFYELLFDTSARGIWNFNGNLGTSSLVQLLRGTPSTAQRVDTGVFMHLYQNSYGLYLQDDYRLTDRITLNLGLRYEVNVPVTEGDNHLSVPDLTVESASCTPKPGCLYIPAGTRGLPDATYRSDLNNIAPRLGFAWRPTASENFVIRSGYGIYYDQTLLNAHLNARLNPPFRITQLITNPGTATINTIFNESPAQTPPGGSFMLLNYKDPYQHQWNVGTQFTPLPRVLLDIAYVGTRGKALARFHRINQPAPGQPVPFPQFQPTLQVIDNTAESKYDALQLKIEKRGVRDLNIVSSYTWSRCLDNGSFFGSGTSGGTVAQDPNNLEAEWGACQYNTDHRFVTNLVYRVPVGAGRTYLTSGVLGAILGNWDVSGILTLQSGHPFTVSRGVPQSGTVPTGGSDRPDIVADPFVAGQVAANPTCVAPTEVHTVQNWFNPCAFMAAPGRFGNNPRGNLDGPRFDNFDLSILREIPISDAQRMRLEFQIFNLFNKAHYNLPIGNFDSRSFSQILQANVGSPRQMQIGIKYIF